MSGLSKFMNLLGFGKQEKEDEKAVDNKEPVSVDMSLFLCIRL